MFPGCGGEGKFPVNFEYRKNIEFSYSLLSYVCSKEEVGQEANETISDLPQKEEVEI